MMRARGLGFRASGRWLVTGVDLDVAPGEVVALLGPNGAGKSTVLSLLAGDRAPARGEASLEGRPLHRWRLAALARRRSVLRQDLSLPFAFTAAEVASLGRLAWGDSRDAQAAVREALEAADALPLAQRLYPTLSGGERQRVQLARALAQVWSLDGQPRWLLLDEPTSALDLEHQHRCLERVRGLARELGLGVLAVLHDVGLAARYADRAVLLQDGAVLDEGPVQRVLEPGVLSRCFRVPFETVTLSDGRRMPVALGAAA